MSTPSTTITELEQLQSVLRTSITHGTASRERTQRQIDALGEALTLLRETKDGSIDVKVLIQNLLDQMIEPNAEHHERFRSGWGSAFGQMSAILHRELPSLLRETKDEKDYSASLLPGDALASPSTTETLPVITGSTSDGYHTFDELYDYRRAYNAALFNAWSFLGYHGVHKSWRHSDGELAFGGGWFIVVAQLPTGQISNHYKAEYWDLFQIEERETPDTYDGHTPQIALDRLLQFVSGADSSNAKPAVERAGAQRDNNTLSIRETTPQETTQERKTP